MAGRRIHVHLHRGGERATDDAEGGTAHDPKSGRFTAGSGAEPKTPQEHAAQARYHGEQVKHHTQKAGMLRGLGYQTASEAAKIEAQTHRSAQSHHQSKAGSSRQPSDFLHHEQHRRSPGRSILAHLRPQE